MSIFRRRLLNINPFCDINGKQICTTLHNGTQLNWKQLVHEGSKFSTVQGIYSGTYSVEEGVAHFSQPASTTYPLVLFTCDYLNDGSEVICLAEVKNIKNYYNFGTCKSLGVSAQSNKNIASFGTTFNNVNTLIKIENSDEFRAGFWSFSKNDHEIYIKSIHCYDLDVMFADAESKKPATADHFNKMFWSDGESELGYVEYTQASKRVVAKNGRLWYA